jgi:hypothetical protein
MIRRREMIEALDLLADVRFQYDIWVRGGSSAAGSSFNDLIADLYDTAEVREALKAPLSESGLAQKEHRALENAIVALDALLEDHPSDEPDEVILQDRRWPQIRILAGRAAKTLRESA